MRDKENAFPRDIGHGASSGLSKMEWRDLVKVQRGCSHCGYAADARVLDFHHRPDEKKLFTLGGPGFAKKSWAAIDAEIAKCEVLCANCHRVETTRLKIEGATRTEANLRSED